jgi:hypothetical protein
MGSNGYPRGASECKEFCSKIDQDYSLRNGLSEFMKHETINKLQTYAISAGQMQEQNYVLSY